MLQNEFQLMLNLLFNDKKAIKSFSRKGYFEYNKEDILHGEAAIVNNKALVLFIKENSNEPRIIAAVSFAESGTIIFKLFDSNYSQHEMGFNNPRGRFYSRQLSKDEVVKEISSICTHCSEAKKDFSFSKSNKLSKKDVESLLGKTIQKLQNSRFLQEKDENLCK